MLTTQEAERDEEQAMTPGQQHFLTKRSQHNLLFYIGVGRKQ